MHARAVSGFLITGLITSAMALGQSFNLATIAGGAPPATPVAATSAGIGQPLRCTADPSGNLYFSAANSVFKMDTSGNLTLVAGNSRAGYTGDGGLAINAELNKPSGVAIDSAGNVYIADSLNSVVRMVAPNGIISTFAGNGGTGYAGDYGPATGANMNLPSGIAVDKSGNLYITDSGNNVIRKVSGGIITTFAGNNLPGYAGDGALASSAQLLNPNDVAVDASGNVYIADTGNWIIREVTVNNGNINTVAGEQSLGAGYAGDGGPATSAQLYIPYGVAVDSSGNIYISEYGDGRIRKVTQSNGKISTIAGNGSYGFSGDGGTATSASFADPWGLCVDGGGNIYVADLWNYRIRKITSGGEISTVAGNGIVSYSGDGGPATQAQLNTPEAVAVDSSGNIYIADTQNQRIRAVTPQGVIHTIAGTGTAGSSGDNGPAANAQLNSPSGLAVDAKGNLYVADTGNDRVRVIAPNGIITPFAGSGTAGFSGDGGAATGATLYQPRGLAVDASGSVYIADFANSRVRKVTPDGNIATIAGNGVSGYSGDGGPATQAALNGPSAVAVDPSGNVYIADTNGNRVREVSGGTITTIAGTGGDGYSGENVEAATALLASPRGIAADGAGNVYVGDSGSRIMRISPAGTISTVGGQAPTGYLGDGGPATNGEIDGPVGMVLNGSGNVYFADSLNNAVRELQVSGYYLSVSSVANAASEAGGAIAPGEVVVVYGSQLGPGTLATYQVASNGTISDSLAGTRILFNGIPSPVIYTLANQAAVVVPFEVTGSQVQIVAQYQNQTSPPLTVPVAAAAPGVFTLNSSGQGQAAALNQDASLNGAGNPAKTGSFVTLYATGAGLEAPGVDGTITVPSSPLTGLMGMAALPTVTIGGQNAMVQFAGNAPGEVAGMLQINVQVPTGIQTGASVAVVVTFGGVASQSGVTIAVSN